MKSGCKYLFILVFFGIILSFIQPTTYAGWVNGYFRKDGTYVNGYYRTDPDIYKWNNYSFNGDWSDSYNDQTYYNIYGYDPEPFDNENVNTYTNNSYNSYYSDYDFYYDDYNSYYSDYDYYDW